MNMKKIISSTLMASMLLGSSVCSVMALEENSVDKGESKIVAEVFDYGESVTSVVVDLGSVISADELKEDAFEVFAKNEEPEACIGISTGKTYYEGSRDITNMYVNSTSIPDGEADAEGQYHPAVPPPPRWRYRGQRLCPVLCPKGAGQGGTGAVRRCPAEAV